MKRIAVILSPNYENHARKYLKDCMDGINRQDWQGEKKIFITDNQSTDESFKFLKATAPHAVIIRNKTNDGFAKAVNDAMRLAMDSGYDYLFLLNMDAVAETDCISCLIRAVESDGKIGAVQARIMLWPEMKKVNSTGNVTHFLGFGYCNGYGNEWSGEISADLRDICFPSGAAALYRKDVLTRIGLFDEEFEIYNEDQDLGWRMWLAGWRCVVEPMAVVYHKYQFAGKSAKYYRLERNRILTIIKNYQLSTLLLIFPAFILMEFGVLMFALQNGWFKEKMYVYRYFLSIKNWRYIINARKTSQTLRRLKDREIVGMFSSRIWYEEIGDWKLHMANCIMNIYWQIAKRIIKINSGEAN